MKLHPTRTRSGPELLLLLGLQVRHLEQVDLRGHDEVVDGQVVDGVGGERARDGGARGRQLPVVVLLVHQGPDPVDQHLPGGLVPDVYQQFTKMQGVFANPTSAGSPAKLRLAFEAAPFGLLVEQAGGKTSDGVTGGSVLDVKIEQVDQRTALCIGSSKEVDRFNDMICMVD